MAADIFGGRVDHHRRAMVEGPAQQRRRRVVDDQWNPQRAADIGDFFDGKHLQLGLGRVSA